MRRAAHIPLLFIISLPVGQAAAGNTLLTGATRLSCEALLCLSSGVRPGACGKALSYYFAIRKISWAKTFRARLRFLNKCPTGSPDLARTVARAAGRCETSQLSAALNARAYWLRYEEDEQPDRDHLLRALPGHCSAYFNHPLTAGFKLPRYRKICHDPAGPGLLNGLGTHAGPTLRKPCYLRWEPAE